MRRRVVAVLAGSLLAISMAGVAVAFSPSGNSPWVMLDGRDGFCVTKAGETGALWENSVSGVQLCWPVPG